jgi:hypothetical protein
VRRTCLLRIRPEDQSADQEGGKPFLALVL